MPTDREKLEDELVEDTVWAGALSLLELIGCTAMLLAMFFLTLAYELGFQLKGVGWVILALGLVLSAIGQHQRTTTENASLRVTG